MASNIKYPEDEAMYYIEGNNLALITNVDSSGNRSTTDRKNWKAIRESVTDGIMIKYQAEPNPVSKLSDTPDVDNACHSGIVDYIKSRLYMDRAGSSSDQNVSAVALNLSAGHESKWKEMVRRMGMKKRDKTGGTRSIVPYDII
tara:strand:+ start:378 stop:809 length:432 start_codon:yes stop_codon:yes gene_type:complete